MELSIIIVNYKTKRFLGKLLNSIFSSSTGKLKYEVIVVDNCSGYDIKKQIKQIKKKYQLSFEKLKLIENKQNLGFASATNKGLKTAQGKYLLLLNSDTYVFKNTLKKMVNFMEKNKKYAAATCRVELINGNLDWACHRGFPTPWSAFTYFLGLEKIFSHSKLFAQYHQKWKNLKKIHQVDVISGAFFLIRKNALKKIGLLDERFFLYGEDIDWSLRLKNERMKIAYYPYTKIIHYKTSSGRKKYSTKKITHKEKEEQRKASYFFFQTMKQFYNKHYQKKYPWLINKLVYLGINLISKFKK